MSAASLHGTLRVHTWQLRNATDTGYAPALLPTMSAPTMISSVYPDGIDVAQGRTAAGELGPFTCDSAFTTPRARRTSSRSATAFAMS